MPKQRPLKLESLDHILIELSVLEKSEIYTTGNWSFYQILDHLAKSIAASVRGYPKMMPAAIRRTLGPKALKHILKTGKIKAGSKNPDAPQKREEGDEKKALAELREAINEFRLYNGEYAEHSFFGPVNKEDYEKLHSIHAALHLSFVQLKENPTKSTKSALIATKESAKKTTEKPADPKGSPTISKKALKQSKKKTSKKAAKELIDKHAKTLAKEATRKPAKKVAKKVATS